ncbi:glycoside hydrolase family 32 protein [Nocardioides panaciterrulae]|uniref:beta-fructofuranosidase n=1 Tax=Nocardioides panaciterrulae TaxID=661492 RepID=A0A7Y9JC16_9ACTN|nr:beta-fructofuranosidase [Nocardioides panaciterrulae]
MTNHPGGRADPTRPLLHFTAPTGWINDPHGLTFHRGAYHLFHQYVPDSPVWAPHCHWGHAVSTDLLRWEQRPVALAPGDGDDGVWTGCLVTDGAGARILYTSVTHPDLGLGRVRVATPTDDGWDTWKKGDVVLQPPDGLDLVAFRDPFVVREGPGWRMFVGAGTASGEAMALTWTSSDLEAWAYDGVAASRSTTERDPVWMGSLWECPQLVEVDGHTVLLASVWEAEVLHHVGYGLGSSDRGRFVAADWGRLSFGDAYYAPSYFEDSAGRPCLIFWMRGVGGADAGWSGCLSVPYVLSVADGRLRATPHPELAARRGPSPDPEPDLAAGPVDLEWSPDPDGDRLELVPPSGASTSLVVGHGTVTLERPGHADSSMPWSGGDLRVLVDGPVVEVAGADGLLGGALAPPHRLLAGRGALRVWPL